MKRVKRLVYNICNRSSPFFLKNVTHNRHNKKNCLLYFKTDPFANSKSIQKYSHTNLWEIVEIARILDNFGYCIDVIDRGAPKDFKLSDSYDLFIGLGAGNSGKNYATYARQLPSAYKILWAAGPDPVVSDALVRKQYDEFYDRTRFKAPYMRIISEVNFSEFLPYVDAIFCVGQNESFSFNSYKKYNKPIYAIPPAVGNDVSFSKDWLERRNLKKFVCFAGNGFICKGVDLVFEAFERMTDFELEIYGPDTEPAFFEYYGQRLKEAKNIKYKGFINISSQEFYNMCAHTGFVVFYSCSEGCATSVATCIKAGIVPIINYETSINIKDYGILMEDSPDKINNIISNCIKASRMSEDEYKERVFKTLVASQEFSQASFTLKFTKGVLDVISKNC